MIECVPNFSEGSNRETILALEDAIRSVSGTLLLGSELDPDHNRSVFTFAGPAAQVLESAVRAAEVAAKRIDLRRHHGVHPRIGAADVIPFVPLDGSTMEECVEIARRAAEEIWDRASVPSFLYEFAAREPGRRQLEAVRRSATHPDFPPDAGGPELHPSAGACAVGARGILIACNVNLTGPGALAAARSAAKAIRQSSGGIPNVKALAFELKSRGLAQISMNLTRYEVSPLAKVFDRIGQFVSKAEAVIHSTEIIGFPPRAALAGAEEFLALCKDWTDRRILENRISELTVQD